MKRSRLHGLVLPALLCGAILFSSCPNETVENVIGAGTALSLNGDGDWEDVDVVSSASIFKMDSRTLVYVDNGGHTLKKVDVLDPTVAINTAEVGYNVEVIQGSREGNIAVIAGFQTASGFLNSVVKVYDSSLKLVKSFPFGDTEQAKDSNGSYSLGSLGGETGGASLAIGDKYAVVLWTDGNDTWGSGRSGGKGTYVGIYDFVGGGSKHFKARENPGTEEAPVTQPDNAIVNSGIGNPVSVATRGDYVVVGGSTGSAAFKIDADLNPTVAVAKIENDIQSHWALDNGYYALDCGFYTVKAWQWNGSEPPTRRDITGLGRNQIQANRGHVRIVSYDQTDPSKAYVYVKNTSATEGGTTATEGEPNGVYSLDLASGRKEFLFFPKFKNGAGGDDPYALSPWVMDRFVDGSDTWYVIGGGTYEVFKNPNESGTNTGITEITPHWSLEAPSTAHFVKFFKAEDRLFVAVKDGNADDFPPEVTFVLHEIK